MSQPVKPQLWVLLALVLLCTSLVAVVVWMPGPLARWAGQTVTHKVAGRLPMQVTVQAVRWHFFPLGVRLQGVAVESPGEESLRHDFAAMEEVRIFPDWRALRDQKLELSHVEISGLTLVADLASRLEEKPREIPSRSDVRDPLEVRLAQRIKSRLGKLARFIPGDFSAQIDRGHLQVMGVEGSSVTYRLGGRLQLPAGAGGDQIKVEGWLVQAPEVDGETPEPASEGEAGPRMEARVEVDLGAATANCQLRPRYFPVEPLVKLVANRIPESISRRIQHWPELSGDFVVKAGVGQLSWTGQLDLLGVEIQDDALATYPIGPLDVGFSGAANLDHIREVVTLDGFQGTVGALRYQLLGWLEKGEGRPAMDLTLQLRQVPYQDILTAAPPEDLPALEGVVLGGDLDFEFHARGDLDDPEAFLLDYTADWSRLSLTSSPFPHKVYPLAGFPYHPVDPSGKVHQYQLGRGEVGWVPMENVPSALVASVLMSEDITFYQHHGFDEEGLRYAFTQNLKKGRAARGGSTITQQLAKNLFLTKEKTVVRKFQEAVLTYVLEQTLTKHQILETYLNIIEWGPGIYGLGRASATLFGKPAAALTVKESAYLATIIPNPRRFYMYFRRGELTENWDRMVQNLLDRMVQVERITPEQYMEASQEILQFRSPGGEGGTSYGEGEEDWEE